MASNFDFLKKIDKELFSIVEDGEKLFRDEYFNQSIVQFRIYAEKMAKNILNQDSSEMTFDTVLNNLKDKIKSQREQEFIEDLFFIKKEGNKCAHGEDATALIALEVIKRAFEAGINYAYAKKKDEKIDKLIFDETLLITQKSAKEEKLVDKYLKAAQKATDEISTENFLNQKQAEFLSQIDRSQDENHIKNKNYIKDASQYSKKTKGRKKKVLSETELKIKEKVKEARKNLKETVNKKEKVKNQTKKTQVKKNKSKKSKNNKLLKQLLFLLFTILSAILIIKMFGFF